MARSRGGLAFRTDVLGADHGGLHEEEVSTGLGNGLAEFESRNGGCAHGGDATVLLDFANALTD